MGIATFLATTLGKVVAGVLVLVLVLALILGGLYAADYGFEATVVDKSCSPAGTSSVTVQPKLFPIEHTQTLPFDQCSVVQEGNFVIFNVRSERVRLYTEEGGDLIWDSENGPPSGGGGGNGGGSFPFARLV